MNNNYKERFDPQAFWMALNYKRFKLDTSFRKICEETGVDKAAVSRMRSGACPHIDSLWRLSLWLGEPLDKFIVYERVK